MSKTPRICIVLGNIAGGITLWCSYKLSNEKGGNKKMVFQSYRTSVNKIKMFQLFDCNDEVSM